MNEPISPSNPSRLKVLITGALGKLAKHVIAELQKEHSLILTDLREPDSYDERFRRADLTDFAQTLEAVRGADVIIHLAIATPPSPPPLEVPGQVSDYDTRLLAVNPVTTFHLLEAARQCGVRRCIYASSLTVHLGELRKLHYTERDLPVPASLYACTKLFGEHIGEVYGRTHGLEFLALRLGQPFPIGHAHDETWQTNRRARSTFITVEDVARAFGCAVKTPVTSGSFIIVSASDNPRFDMTAARAIGYFPTGYFAADGLSFHPDGVTPTPDRPRSVEE